MKPINEITFDDMYQMERDGEFKNKVPYPKDTKVLETYIFDENQSVKWNREKVGAHNEKIRKAKEDYRVGDMVANQLFYSCLVSAIVADTGLSQEKAQKIYSKAYDDGHSCGYADVITHAIELCDFLTDIL